MTARRFRLLLAALRSRLAIVLAVLAGVLAFAAPAGAYSMKFTPSQLDFGDVAVGSTKQLTFTITNTGTQTFRPFYFGFIWEVAIEQPEGNLGDMAPGETRTFTATWTPSIVWNYVQDVELTTAPIRERWIYRIVGNSVLPGVSVSPSARDLGNVPVGATKSTTVTLTNTSGAAEEVLAPTHSNTDGVTFSSGGSFPLRLEPGEQKDVTLSFSPPREGSFTDTVTFPTASGSYNPSVRLSLQGFTPTPKLEVTPTALDVGDAAVGDIVMRTVTLKNSGNGPADVGLPTVDIPTPFSLTSDVLSTFRLEPGETRQITFGFQWLTIGGASPTIELATTDGKASTTFTVDVRLIGAYPSFVAGSPATVDFGGTVLGSTQTKRLTVRNVGEAPLVLTGTVEAASGLTGKSDFGGPQTVTVAPQESADLSFTFTPTAVGLRAARVRFTWKGAGSEERLVQLFGKGAAAATSGMNFTASTLATASSVPTEVATGDLNGDGATDVAAGFAATGRVAAALGNGDGTFGALTTITTDGAQTDMGLASADVNGDGRDELAVGNGAGTAVYRWTTSGYELLTRASTKPATDVRLGDIDYDGSQDLVALDADAGELTFLLGATGSYTDAGAVPVKGRPRELELVDLVGQGRLTVVLSNPGATSPFSLQIVSPPATPPGTPFDIAALSLEDLELPSAPQAVAAGHLNADGALDLTTGDAVGFGDTDRGRVQNMRSSATGAGGEAVAVADFDGDGVDDQALASSAAGAVSLQRNIGDAAYGSPTTFPVTVASAAEPADLATTDFNGDGRPDVVAASGAAGLTVLMNAATFTAAPGTGRALIDEFRPGTTPVAQLHNPSRTQSLRLGGWQLRYSNGARWTLPQTYQLPPRASRAIVLPAALLDSLGGGVTPSSPDGVVGVALYDPEGTRIDAVGLASAPAGFREGTGLVARDLGPIGVFSRREEAGARVDTGDNAADFRALNPNAVDGDGTVLGVPGFRAAYDATNRNDILQSSLYDPTVPASQAPNREREGDVLTIRRRITNCSGGLTTGVCVNADPNAPAVAVTRLFARVTELSTIGNSTDAVLVGQSADMPGTPYSYALDYRTVGSVYIGGDRGFGIGGIVDLADRNTGKIVLYPGESITVGFKFRVLRGGKFTFGYAADDDVIPVKRPSQTPEVGIPADTPAQSPNAPLFIPPASAAAPEAIAGTVAAPVKPVAAQAALTTSKPAAKAKCLTNAQYKRLKPKQRKKATLCKRSSKTTKATGKRPSSKKTTSPKVTNSTSKKGMR